MTSQETTIEDAVAMPSREQEELVERIKEYFGEDDVPPLPPLTAMTLDEDADLEDLEASWSRASEPASSSFAAASSGSSTLMNDPLREVTLRS